MSDAAAVGTATGTLLDLVEGKAGGKLKVVAERTGTLAVVGGLAAASGGGGGFALAEEAERVVQRLCSFYATESSEEVQIMPQRISTAIRWPWARNPKYIVLLVSVT